MKSDERIALLAFLVSDQWDLAPWVDVKFDTTDNKFHTFILLDTPEGLEEAFEIATLKDAATLWATAQEYAHNIKALTTAGALASEEADDEVIMVAAVSRILNKNVDLPFSMITVPNWVQPELDILPTLSEKQEKTGLSALKVVKLLGGMECGNNVFHVNNETQRWNSKTAKWEDAEQGFTVSVAIGSLFQFSCDETIPITEQNFDILVEATEDVLFNLPKWDDENYTVADWAVWLFACRVKPDVLSSFVKKLIPAELEELFAETHSYTLEYVQTG